MNKISQRVEELFSHAVAMDQSGRMRNTIYCIEDEIYVLNYDMTVMLRFILRKTETPFKHPVSFRANDFESSNFYEKDGKIIFVEEGNGFVRTKSCSTPERTPEDVRKLFDGFQRPKGNTVRMTSAIQPFIDESLSHIEIKTRNDKLHIVQRNIYSGALIEIMRKQEGLRLSDMDDIQKDFGPFGIRTADFLALFSFIEHMTFSFPANGGEYIWIKSEDPRIEMEGIISLCIYDELGGVEESKKDEPNTTQDSKPTRKCKPKKEESQNGRQITEKRGNEQSLDSETSKPAAGGTEASTAPVRPRRKLEE